VCKEFVSLRTTTCVTAKRAQARAVGAHDHAAQRACGMSLGAAGEATGPSALREARERDAAERRSVARSWRTFFGDVVRAVLESFRRV